jgi:hypothetical protein
MFNEPKRISVYRAKYATSSGTGIYLTIVKPDGVYYSYYDGRSATQPRYAGMGDGIVIDGVLKEADE